MFLIQGPGRNVCLRFLKSLSRTIGTLSCSAPVLLLPIVGVSDVLAQVPTQVQVIARAGSVQPTCSPVHDFGNDEDTIAFIRGLRVELIGVQHTPSGPVVVDPFTGSPLGIGEPPFIQAVSGSIAIRDPSFNPVRADDLGPPTRGAYRYVIYEAETPINSDNFRKILYARIDDLVHEQLSANNNLGDIPRCFPQWFGDGDSAVYETTDQDSNGRGFFDINIQEENVIPVFDSEEIIAEAPAASPEPSLTAPTYNYVASHFANELAVAQQVFIYPYDTPSKIQPIVHGSFTNWMGPREILYIKSLQSHRNVFVNRWDKETPDHTATLMLTTGGAPSAPKLRSVLQTPVNIVSADIDGDGNTDAAVATRDGEGISLLFCTDSGSMDRGGPPCGTCDGPFDILANDLSPSDLVITDPNVDSTIDLFVVERNADLLRVFLNNGQGRFDSNETFPVGDEPVSLTSGHFNADSHLDIAVANRTGDSVSVLQQNLNYDPNDPNEPRFTSSTFSPGDGPSAIASGDLNGDGHVDLAVSLESEHTVEIWGGDGNGNFTFAYSLAPIDANEIALIGPTPSGLVLTDFGVDTNDPNEPTGTLDIAASNVAADKVTVWRNLSSPTTWAFSAARFYTVGDQPTGIAVGDVTGDGDVDLITANKGSNNGTILPGDGEGFFGTGVTVPTGSRPWRATVGYFSGNDQDLDMAFACGEDDDICIVEQDPLNPGQYRSMSQLATGDTPRAVCGADLDGDGRADLVSANFVSDGVSIHFRSVLTQENGSTIANPWSYRGYNDLSTPTFAPGYTTVFDFNNDGKLDVIAASEGRGQPEIAVFAGIGNRSFSRVVDSSLPTTGVPVIRALSPGRFNSDDYDDFAVVSEDEDTREVFLDIYLADGSGGFENRTRLDLDIGNVSLPDLRGVRSLLAKDENSDGVVDDFYVLTSLGARLIRYSNDTIGTTASISFDDRVTFQPSFKARQFVVEHLDGDSVLDCAISFSGSGKVALLLTEFGSLTDSFEANPTDVMLDVPGAWGLATGNFDGLHGPDLAVTSIVENNVRYFLNDPNAVPSFVPKTPVACGPGPIDLAVGDFGIVDPNDPPLDDVIIVNAFGPDEKMLTNVSSVFGRPVGSISSGMVAATAIDETGSRQIYVADINAATHPSEVRMTNEPGIDHGTATDKNAKFSPGYSWNPEGTRLYYHRSQGIYMIEVE